MIFRNYYNNINRQCNQITSYSLSSYMHLGYFPYTSPALLGKYSSCVSVNEKKAARIWLLLIQIAIIC